MLQGAQKEPLAVTELEERYGITRRTLQRTHAKLARLGLIEHVSWMNSRYRGRTGWRLLSRMSGGLSQPADRIDRWRGDVSYERRRKDEQLVELLRQYTPHAEGNPTNFPRPGRHGSCSSHTAGSEQGEAAVQRVDVAVVVLVCGVAARVAGAHWTAEPCQSVPGVQQGDLTVAVRVAFTRPRRCRLD